MIKVNVEREKMGKEKLEMFMDFFADQGVKFVDIKTGEEIKAGIKPTVVCKVCGNETPKGEPKCMWCQNRLSDAD